MQLEYSQIIKKSIVSFLFIFIVLFILGNVSALYVIGRKNSSNYNDMDICIITSDNTKLYAKTYVPEFESSKWVILVHSYGSDHSLMGPYAKYYCSNGYHVLSLDNRSHGVSEGTYIGMGYLDQFDILEWVKYIIDIDPDVSIVLHGVSMGASALMMLSSQSNLPSNISCIIEDSGYSSAESYLTWKLQQKFHLPSFPIIPITAVVMRLRAGYWLYDASALDAVKESNVPILFIHGSKDLTVPVGDVYELYNNAACEKSLLIVQDAGHGASVTVDPDIYWTTVINFINQF